MTWIKFALVLMEFANSIISSYKMEALKQAGEDREKLKQLQLAFSLSERLKEVKERADKLTAVEIRAELKKQGDFRDD